MTNNNNFKSKVILVLVSLIIIIALGIIYQVLALNSPTNQPPTGGGTIGVGLMLLLILYILIQLVTLVLG